MNRKKWILIATAAVMLLSCSSESEQVDMKRQLVELKLASSLDIQTRAYTLTQATQIASGEKVYAWVDEVGASEYIHAWELTADGAGNFSGTTQNYPVSGAAVNVYALHGNFTGITAGTTTFPTSLDHSVAADQATNYAKSDLLCAKATNCARQVAAHNLQFSHLLSKVEVYLVSGTGMTDTELASATVKILGTKPTTVVTLSKTATPIATIGTASGTATDITAKMSYDGTATVTISSVAQNAPALAEAVIVPQSINADFIQITVGTQTFTAQVNKTFDAGKKYVFNVLVNKSGLLLSSTITDWDDGGTTVTNAK